MSLPNSVLRLSTDVLAEINADERLAFAYAYGPALSGFGDEAALVCVWEAEVVPPEANEGAAHLTTARFAALLEEVSRGEGWEEPGSEPLRVIARFAEGILLADDSELGSKARADVAAFPEALAVASRERVEAEAEEIAKLLGESDDPWERAELLVAGLHRAYVALFAAGGHFYPGREHRSEYVERYLLGADVPEAERLVWEAANRGDEAARRELPESWRTLAATVLANC
jgi:hypothetical protein